MAVSDPDAILATPGGDGGPGSQEEIGPASAPAGRAGRRATSAVEVVVGLPRTLADRAGSSAQDAIELADRLARADRPGAGPARRRAADHGGGPAFAARGRGALRGQRAVIDQVAAVAILQGWLDQRRTVLPQYRTSRQTEAGGRRWLRTCTMLDARQWNDRPNAPSRWRSDRRGAGWTAPRGPAPSASADGGAPSACCRSDCWAPIIVAAVLLGLQAVGRHVRIADRFHRSGRSRRADPGARG